ncbi:MAG TPA: VOC family protein [Propionibacteriaceae bacterium]|nr:VOC family protein [Propionibacteriaceae bacterium]
MNRAASGTQSGRAAIARVGRNSRPDYLRELLPVKNVSAGRQYRLDSNTTDKKRTKMLRGFTTINYWADDVEAAQDWYAQVLEAEPYFVRPEEGPPAYVEFRVGPDEDELGLIDRRYAPPSTPRDPGGAIMHWQVDDVSAAVARLLELGATEYQPVTEREAGFVTASVVDPFGNILGLMYSPHFLQMHAEQQ